jgi:hypothetical protein
MKASDYRREYSAFCSAAERAAYDLFSGRDAAARLAEARERSADLFTREAAADLERARDDVPEGFETERAALSALTSAARLGYAERRAAGVTEELGRCEAAARVEWGGARLELRELPGRLAAEPDAARRRELAARQADALRPCDDLRAARLDALGEAARELGLEDYAALREEAARADFAGLSATAEAFLARTAGPYLARLRDWAARELPPDAAREPDRADSPSFARLARLDHFFNATGARATYDAAMAGLGVRVERQTNLRVEETTRATAARADASAAAALSDASAGADADASAVARADATAGERAAANARARVNATTAASILSASGAGAGWCGEASAGSCEASARTFALSPPEDVRLVFAARAGADFYRHFFREAGRAQQSAWASRDLASRYPEFVRAPDGATAEGFGSLFRLLFTDPAWLAARRGRPDQARAASRPCALAELHDARRDSALFLAWLELARAGATSESLAAEHAARLSEATGFRHEPASALRDALGAGARAAELLRARLFAAALAEYLRTRHGTRWWDSRAAGDELIDIWNTASRYPVEELARLVGAGPLEPELLADSLLAAPGDV